MIRKTIPLLFFIYSINAQIALPTFQGVHKPHTTVAESDSQTFSYTGSQQTFTVPSGVTTITIKAWGAQGGSGGFWSNSNYCGTGGKGGYSTGELSVTPGNTVYICWWSRRISFIMLRTDASKQSLRRRMEWWW